MSKDEIIAALPGLTTEDRDEIFQRLCFLQEQDLLRGIGPTSREKKLLDDELAKFDQDGHRGTPWREAMRQIRASRDS
jgi:hypothetical protein